MAEEEERIRGEGANGGRERGAVYQEKD